MADRLVGAQIFSSLDLAQCYHHIIVLDEDAVKMAFKTPFGHYQFVVLSFGLTNDQQFLNPVFQKYFGKFVLEYLDDILYSQKMKRFISPT